MVPLQGTKGTVEIQERAAQPPLSHAVSAERAWDVVGGRKGDRGLCLMSLKELSLSATSHFLELSHMANSCKGSWEM